MSPGERWLVRPSDTGDVVEAVVTWISTDGRVVEGLARGSLVRRARSSWIRRVDQ